jgi:hypothetical protein
MRSRFVSSLLNAKKSVARSARITRRRVSRRALCCALAINLVVWPGLRISL